MTLKLTPPEARLAAALRVMSVDQLLAEAAKSPKLMYFATDDDIRSSPDAREALINCLIVSNAIHLHGMNGERMSAAVDALSEFNRVILSLSMPS